MIARIFMIATLLVAFDSAAYEQATHGFLTRECLCNLRLGSVPDVGQSSLMRPSD